MSKHKKLLVVATLLIVATIAMQVTSIVVLTAKNCPVYAQDSPQNPKCDQQKYDNEKETRMGINVASIVLSATAIAAILYHFSSHRHKQK